MRTRRFGAYSVAMMLPCCLLLASCSASSSNEPLIPTPTAVCAGQCGHPWYLVVKFPSGTSRGKAVSSLQACARLPEMAGYRLAYKGHYWTPGTSPWVGAVLTNFGPTDRPAVRALDRWLRQRAGISNVLEPD